jgi:hypothetical protein
MSKRYKCTAEEVIAEDKVEANWVSRVKTHEDEKETEVIEETNMM